jgi:esterase/lipase superfamily enzyme
MILSGCTSRTVLGLDHQASGVKSSAVVPVYLATTRARSNDLSQPYSAERSQTLNFAEFEIGIPFKHVPGELESSGSWPDPKRHFVARGYQPIDGTTQFVARLNAELERRPPDQREVLIFVHGYNNNIADSTFRAAQIAHDFDVDAVMLHYAWPSGGAIPLYVFDRDSAVVGRGGLAETIKIAGQTKAKRIILVAHSMGVYVAMEALRELALSQNRRVLQRIGGVVLAAPDVDIDAFQSQVADIEILPQPFIVLVSRRDRALGFSRRIAGGHPRVGSGSDIPLLQRKGIAVFDTSDLDGGAHNVFATSPTMINLVAHEQLMRRFIEDGQPSMAEAIVSEGGTVIEGASALAIYLPARLLGGITARSQ